MVDFFEKLSFTENVSLHIVISDFVGVYNLHGNLQEAIDSLMATVHNTVKYKQSVEIVN